MTRLRRVQADSPGFARRRAGRGWVFLDDHGRRIGDPVVIDRCKHLAIPPAWREVRICPQPNGHLQAVGTDEAGRRQYLYHPLWRERRERAKFHHVQELAAALPAAREHVRAHLALPGMPRERALAVAFRLLDTAMFRVGGEVYAARHASYGLATLRKEHLRIRRDGVMTFRYTAKSGLRREVSLDDPELLDPLGRLRRRRGGGPELLAHRARDGWHDISSTDINDYLKALLGPDASAKDFRTWHATVLAARGLAGHGPVASVRERRAVVRDVVAAVAAELGNTPAVCRASYIDPRLLDRYEHGRALPAALLDPATAGVPGPRLREQVEAAVLDLLD